MSVKRTISMITWREIREQVSLINPELALLIDNINPQYTLIKASYLYGDLIVDQGKFQLPSLSTDKLATIDNCDLPANIKSSLQGSALPIFVSLKNSNEMFLKTMLRDIPINLFNAGTVFGIRENVFDSARSGNVDWSLSAGSRSVILLPRITDRASLERIRLKYAIPLETNVKSLYDHWSFIVQVAQSKMFSQLWTNDILLFPNNLLQNDTIAGYALREYLCKQTYNADNITCNNMRFSLQWQIFAEIIASFNIKLRPYLLDQIKHILSIVANKSPGFKIIDSSQDYMPLYGLQQVFTDVYQLKEYIPTILAIAPLNSLRSARLLYYSLAFPTVLEGNSEDSATSTIILDLKKIKAAIDTYKNYANKALDQKHNILSSVALDYFHAEYDLRYDIKASSIVFADDPGFIAEQQAFPDRILCDTGQFWRGCIRIKSS